MKPKVYVEATVISYLTAQTSRDAIIAGHQAATRIWWDEHSDQYDLHASQLVVQEAAAGDPTEAHKRLVLLEPLKLLEANEDSVELAGRLVAEGAFPAVAAGDALHVATAVVNGMDFLVTWNLKHLANAHIRLKIEEICRTAGLLPTVICTPEELSEGEPDAS